VNRLGGWTRIYIVYAFAVLIVTLWQADKGFDIYRAGTFSKECVFGMTQIFDEPEIVGYGPPRKRGIIDGSVLGAGDYLAQFRKPKDPYERALEEEARKPSPIYKKVSHFKCYSWKKISENGWPVPVLLILPFFLVGIGGWIASGFKAKKT
jgi:hypothetical protein